MLAMEAWPHCHAPVDDVVPRHAASRGTKRKLQEQRYAFTRRLQ